MEPHPEPMPTGPLSWTRDRDEETGIGPLEVAVACAHGLLVGMAVLPAVAGAWVAWFVGTPTAGPDAGPFSGMFTPVPLTGAVVVLIAGALLVRRARSGLAVRRWLSTEDKCVFATLGCGLAVYAVGLTAAALGNEMLLLGILLAAPLGSGAVSAFLFWPRAVAGLLIGGLGSALGSFVGAIAASVCVLLLTGLFVACGAQAGGPRGVAAILFGCAVLTIATSCLLLGQVFALRALTAFTDLE